MTRSRYRSRALVPGQRVLFDDGHFESVAESCESGVAVVRITYAPPSGQRLGAEKGINLPETELDLPLFAEDDEQALAFAAQHGDIVGGSFVRGPEDVRALNARLTALSGNRLGLVLKIETALAFARLPAILLAALERPPVGVMIARGDTLLRLSDGPR